MPTSFRRAARLVESRAFKRVFAKSRRFGCSGYTLLVRENGKGFARLGLAIAKKCAPRAVDRNRLKRLARESFRANAASLPAVDVVVVCARGAAAMPNEGLRESLDLAWTQLRNRSWVESLSL